MTTNYYETVGYDGCCGFKVYHYDESGNREIVLYQSERNFDTPEQAADAAAEWLEQNGIEAELV